MKTSKHHIAIVFFACLLNSCAWLYGVKNIRGYKQSDYTNFLSKIELQNYDTIIANRNQIVDLINLGDDSIKKHDLSQPVQIMFFVHNELKSYHANCYAKGGLSNVNWNTDKRFERFVPKSAINTNAITFKLNDIQSIFPTIEKDNPNLILVFHTLMLEKISKTAINTINQNLIQYDKLNSTTVYLVNTDNFFSSLDF